MVGGASKGGGKRSNKARSVGAAASSHPNGAILNDNDGKLQRRQRFKAWEKGYRDAHLKPNAWTAMYDKSPAPPKGN
jgi:hypothetical protein